MAPQRELVLKLTSMRYKKEGVSEEDFHEYCSKVHAPKAALIQSRHGALKVAHLFQEKMPWALRTGFKVDDHDAFVHVWVRTTDEMLNIVADPDFQELAGLDNEYTDGTKATLTAGWEEIHLEDGKLINVEDGKSIYPPYAECVKAGNASERKDPGQLSF